MTNFMYLPFPWAQVNNNESLVLISVDVVEHANWCSFELEVYVLSGVFLGNVENGLGRLH